MPKLTNKPNFSQVSVIGRPQPKSWADYRQGCLDNYGGGHRTDGMLEAFQHGMETVFNLLEAEFPPAEQCQRVPALARSHEALLAFVSDIAENWQHTALATRAKELLAEAEKVSQ